MSMPTTEMSPSPNFSGYWSGEPFAAGTLMPAELRLINSSKNLNLPARWGAGSYYCSDVTSVSVYLTTESNLTRETATRLRELSALKGGWDDGDALPISPDAIKAASDVLRGLSMLRPFQNPSIVPTFDGSIQLEWHSTSRSLEFEYTSTQWSILGVDSANTQHPRYFTESMPLNMATDLEPFYIWFSTGELIWPSR
jgi:hypothetical protein